MPTTTLSGRTVAYSDEGSGPAVVLVHGLLMDCTMWDPITEALRDSYRVVTLDAPGHGESAPAALGYSVDDLARDTLALLDSLGVQQAVLGGQSLGGFVSQRIAVWHPERVRGLMLMDTNSGTENQDALPQYEAFLQVALSDGVSEDLANILLLILTSEPFAATAEGDVWRKKLIEGKPADYHAVARAVLDRPDFTDSFKTIKAPAIVVHGEDDVAIGIDQAERMASTLNAPLVRVPAAGHASPLERPEIVIPPLLEFLASLP